MENDAVFRHEMKYLINRRDMDSCISRITMFAGYDRHATKGSYLVRSLYYDDMYSSAYEDKESGVRSRCKYRIRVYDGDDTFISLEKKIKEGSFVRKESAVLTRGEYDMIRNGDTGFLLARSEKAACDFALACRIDMLHPEVIVDYERIPFVYDHGNVRITFDTNLRAVDSDDVFSDDPSYSVLDKDLLIMEVKYTEFLPDILRAILPEEGARLALSKYVMCEDVLRRMMLR
ncbi:MAG: polyphosphate polymerase domain-containing protein [Lachnospiraceae bacterium]|nr:polyphosphate polymerase domain-containing protein [Lachnospiraceae bacterium]